MRAATVNATVVKKPNTFCARTREECIAHCLVALYITSRGSVDVLPFFSWMFAQESSMCCEEGDASSNVLALRSP